MAQSFAIGIDIGGTKIALDAVAPTGRILARLSLPTEAEQGFARAIERLTQFIEKVMVEVGLQKRDLQGIGIGRRGQLGFREGQ